MDPDALAKLFEPQPSTSELAVRVQRLEAQLAQARFLKLTKLGKVAFIGSQLRCARGTDLGDSRVPRRQCGGPTVLS
jgi:hypothetical protein